MEPSRNSHQFSRRDVLKLGSAALLASAARPLAAGLLNSPRPCAERVICFWCSGGLSHLDTWDPKPGRPSAGELTAIDTSVPGIQISEAFPRLATQMHHCTLYRSVVGSFIDHVPAESHMLTGAMPRDGHIAPGVGSICVEHWNRAGIRAPYYAISGRAPKAGALGSRFDAAFIASLDDITQFKNFESANDVTRYGDTTFGRSTRLAMHLVENGARFVHIHRGGFDTHANNFDTMRTHGDVMDRALASLIEDLAEHSLLATTLVAIASEFGRSPGINEFAGRNHWSECFSCLCAGGGMPAGTVVGASDRDGASVVDAPVTVSELHARILDRVGINRSTATPLNATRVHPA